ncbi:MAG: hypothetical protein WB711_14355 [Terriglobales bacterium]
MRRQDNSSAERLPARATGKIPAWFFHVVSSRHPIERLCHEVANSVGLGYLSNGDERAKTVHRDWPLIFNSVAALDVLLFSFLKQVGPRGHTNSHCHPHFSTIGDQVQVRVGRVIERGH